MMAMAEEKLSLRTRRIIMEADKMKNEVFYQEREMRKLDINTAQTNAQIIKLQAECKSGKKSEEAGAKKSHMYMKIIEKLKNKIKEKEEEIEAFREERHR